MRKPWNKSAKQDSKPLVITGQVKSAALCQPLENTQVKGVDINGQIISHGLSDTKGRWSLKFSPQIENIRFEKNGYTQKTIPLTNNFPSVIRLLEHKLIGYQDRLWYSPGSVIAAYVHAPSEFTAKLYRYGYNIQKIKDIGKFAPMLQQVPDGYFVSSGLYWNRTIEYEIANNIVPGIYGLKLTSIDGDPDCYNIVFIVSSRSSPRQKRARLLVLASTTTWQTYNVWGGRSRYRNFEVQNSRSILEFIQPFALKWFPESLKQQLKKIFKTQIPVSIDAHPNAWQFKPLSIRRPHPNCCIIEEDVHQKFTSHLAAGEWRILAWLEREKIDYDVISGYELHHDPELLLNYDAVILSTHCEYWSREMFNGLKLFHQKGGAILNLSGNSIYREIKFQTNGSLQCTGLRFNNTVADESALLGVRFDMRGYGTSAPFQVLKADHWIFHDTNLKNNDLFARSSLNAPSQCDGEDYNPSQPGIKVAAKLQQDGGSGWETDKLTETAPQDVVIVAKGMNPQHGGADMIVREPSAGSGLVFSASSITFGGALLVDKVSSTIVKNVIAKALH